MGKAHANSMKFMMLLGGKVSYPFAALSAID